MQKVSQFVIVLMILVVVSFPFNGFAQELSLEKQAAEKGYNMHHELGTYLHPHPMLLTNSQGTYQEDAPGGFYCGPNGDYYEFFMRHCWNCDPEEHHGKVGNRTKGFTIDLLPNLSVNTYNVNAACNEHSQTILVTYAIANTVDKRAELHGTIYNTDLIPIAKIAFPYKRITRQHPRCHAFGTGWQCSYALYSGESYTQEIATIFVDYASDNTVNVGPETIISRKGRFLQVENDIDCNTEKCCVVWEDGSTSTIYASCSESTATTTWQEEQKLTIGGNYPTICLNNQYGAVTWNSVTSLSRQSMAQIFDIQEFDALTKKHHFFPYQSSVINSCASNPNQSASWLFAPAREARSSTKSWIVVVELNLGPNEVVATNVISHTRDIPGIEYAAVPAIRPNSDEYSVIMIRSLTTTPVLWQRFVLSNRVPMPEPEPTSTELVYIPLVIFR